MAHQRTDSHLDDSITLFRYYKQLAERAMAQCPDAGLFATLDGESNSIALIVKHVAGNMRSRWTDFLTTDGEKPDRDRDAEFDNPPRSRAELIAVWEEGWRRVFEALDGLSDGDMTNTVAIRGEAHSVMQAVNRQMAHYAYHIGQIVCLSKHFGADAWTALTIPRGRSREFTTDVQAGTKSQR
jgi:hypothetical protein